MSKTNTGLVQHCKEMLGTHYLYGMKGQVITFNNLTYLSNIYNKMYGEKRTEKAKEWIGERATDCSGLISSYTKITRNSQGYYNTATERGKMSSGIPEIPGLLVWKPEHIGVYIGNGQVIEARGFDYGVVTTTLPDNRWTHWLRCCDLTYTEPKQKYTSPLMTLKKGDKGERVGWLQERLNVVFGAGLAVDEEYGSKTQTAVYTYQESLGWNSTGKAGVKTIVALHDGRRE